jgi:hypothetical protein
MKPIIHTEVLKMSKWNDFCAGVSRTTKTTAAKTKHIASKTSLKVKLGNLEGKVAEEYDTLGRIYYTQEVGKVESSEALRDQIKIISDINKQINAVNAELREIKRIEAEEKAAREAEKEARKAAKEAENAASDEDTEAKDESEETAEETVNA